MPGGPTAASRADKRTLYYGWVIAVAAGLGFAVSTGVGNWSFGAFVQPLEDEFGWRRGELSGGASVAMLGIVLGSPLLGIWIDRWGPRSAMLVGGLLGGVGIMLLSQVQTLWHFYALLGLTAVVRTGTTYVSLTALVSRWFPGDSSRGMAIVMSGLGIGGVVFAPLATFLIDALGWRGAYVVLGLIMAGYFVPVAAFIVRDPHARRTRDGRGAGAMASGWAYGDAIRSKTFWLLNLSMALLWFNQVGMMSHAQPIFEWQGFEPGPAATIVGLAALSATAFRLFAGVSYGRLGRPRLFALAVAGAGSASLAILLLPVTQLTVVVFLVLWGIGSGAMVILPPMLTADTYGQRSLGKLLAFTEVTGGVGSVTGPIVGGLLFDSTGSYVPALQVYFVTYVLCGFCFAAFSTARSQTRPPARSVGFEPAPGGVRGS
jgi:MFS family permease